MDNETKEMLRQILANQVIIYKKLDDIESKTKGTTKMYSIKHYVSELKKSADDALPHIE